MYVIRNNDYEDLYVQWDRKVVVFASEEEANEFIKEFSLFFKEVNYSVVVESDMIISIIKSVKYAEIRNICLG